MLDVPATLRAELAVRPQARELPPPPPPPMAARDFTGARSGVGGLCLTPPSRRAAPTFLDGSNGGGHAGSTRRSAGLCRGGGPASGAPSDHSGWRRRGGIRFRRVFDIASARRQDQSDILHALSLVVILDVHAGTPPRYAAASR